MFHFGLFGYKIYNDSMDLNVLSEFINGKKIWMIAMRYLIEKKTIN